MIFLVQKCVFVIITYCVIFTRAVSALIYAILCQIKREYLLTLK